MPTVYPPHFFGLEFTGKFKPLVMLAASVPIGVNRLIRSPVLDKTAILASSRHIYKYRQEHTRPRQEHIRPPGSLGHRVPTRIVGFATTAALRVKSQFGLKADVSRTVRPTRQFS